ncbi:Hypothetical predicted protein [Mytilus galloprovincialis]|nr:Hypothetical predicted protein [Mytilus galloprovincialis]
MTELFSTSDRQATVIPEEEENYLRIANLLIRVAPSAVRIQFNNEFYPGGLKSVLNKNRLNILEPLKRKRIINQAQWDLLFPVTGNTSSESYDLTLMICLLKHLTDIEVSDILPFPGNQSKGADLSRLRYYRNQIMHSDDGTLSCLIFNEWWTEISQAIIRLGGTSFVERCNHLKERHLDANDKEIITELKNISRSLNPVPKGLRKICEDTVGEWKKENVADTRAIRRLSEIMTTHNVAVAVGPSGCGKSTAIHYIALQLALKHEYAIIIVYNPEDIRQFYDPDCKQVFVIDDVFGIATFDENKAIKWLNMSNDIKRILDYNQAKLLASCRTHIFQHRIAKTVGVLADFSCDFISADYCLTEDERECIANLYLTKKEIRDLKSSNTFSKFYFFPVLCRYYSNNNSGCIVKFVFKPNTSSRGQALFAFHII